ncbi:F-box protein SKIP8 [Porphyridium purpureum]|uniref:F-box protein SKIP8 n=1 Tax=Porphyridium purpureum TaxID=35688 RepID=A0A5J4YSW4_PORPP|nr:F-box protein SKIP8 [Porphyridium purpureum]|eukprot:POR2630..scf229_5
MAFVTAAGAGAALLGAETTGKRKTGWGVPNVAHARVAAGRGVLPPRLETQRASLVRAKCWRKDSKEERFLQLERELEACVEKEDYSAAAKVRDELNQLRTDDEVAVLMANLAFYKAFDRQDMLELERAWQRSEQISVIHPFSSECISGFRAVMNSWEEILRGSMMTRPSVTVSNVQISVRGSSATVTCLETISARDESDLRESLVLATNVFAFTNGQWFMCHHHGSPVLAFARK